MPSPTRQGLDRLLAEFPESEVARLFHQDQRVAEALGAAHVGDIFPLPPAGSGGPWTVLDLLDGDQIRSFAIWNRTGSVYHVNREGAVEDEPFITVRG